MMSRLVFGLGLLSTTAFVSPALADGARDLQIVVSKDNQSLVVYDGGQIVAKSRVSTGKAGHSTPTGIFSIIEKKKYHESNIYSNAPMPYMQRITWSGIALHESNSVPNYPASHGCVRLPAKFAKALYQMTERGGHVIITDRAVAPQPFDHPALFKPRNPVTDPVLLSDADFRPTTPDPSLRKVEMAMNEVLPKTGATATAVIADTAPVRILITRRTDRETLVDVQTMLTSLGYYASTIDGQAGRATLDAIARFKSDKTIAAKALLSEELLDALYQAAGKGHPPHGQILVRQRFAPVLEAPIEIADPEIALGTHFLQAIDVHRTAGTAEWNAMTLENRLSPATMKRLGITSQADADASAALARTLDRITIPDEVRRKIEPLISEGSSITISDTGLGPETGQGTDFITLTRTASNPAG